MSQRISARARPSIIALALACAGCTATTTFQLLPSPQEPVCQSAAKAQVFWVTLWRPDQKDVPAREAAAAEGLARFFEGSGCFKSAPVLRLPVASDGTLQAAIDQALPSHDKLVLIGVRELGPIVKLGASLALVEGGTEVVLEVSEHLQAGPAPRKFKVHWQNGGAGVIKGVATLPQDMQAALAVALQPAAR